MLPVTSSATNCLPRTNNQYLKSAHERSYAFLPPISKRRCAKTRMSPVVFHCFPFSVERRQYLDFAEFAVCVEVAARRRARQSGRRRARPAPARRPGFAPTARSSNCQKPGWGQGLPISCVPEAPPAPVPCGTAADAAARRSHRARRSRPPQSSACDSPHRHHSAADRADRGWGRR